MLGHDVQGTGLAFQQEDRNESGASPQAPVASAWTTRVDAMLNWSRSQSLAPLALTGSCCAIFGVDGEFDLGLPTVDAGGTMPLFAPRHADLLIVGGPMTPRRIPIIERVFAEMATPSWVVAYGNCACSGGTYGEDSTDSGLGGILPVDIFILGCPPRSEALVDGLAKLKRRIRG